MRKYVVAVKRARRGTGASTNRVLAVPGVSIKGGDDLRAIIEAPEEAAEEVGRRFGADLIIEPEILHNHD